MMDIFSSVSESQRQPYYHTVDVGRRGSACYKWLSVSPRNSLIYLPFSLEKTTSVTNKYRIVLSLGTALLSQARSVSSAPTSVCLADPSCGPIPGESTIYSNYKHVEAPWPGNTTGAVLNTTIGPPGPDDLLFQNLLAAEWIIFSFYQHGVETFNKSAFVKAGFPTDTYDRIQEIRNNEAGHLRIFQNQISSNSIKPGSCKYQYPFSDAKSYLALQLAIELGSMAFLTGLELQAQTDLTKGALVAIAETETRHNVWSQVANWHAGPVSRPADTCFPSANQILQVITTFTIEGSCPTENPEYPFPTQDLSSLRVDMSKTNSIAPGSKIFDQGKKYYAVFFHGVLNITQPFDVTDYSTTVPQELESKGIIELAIAAKKGAPTADSVVAGSALLLEQPEKVGLEDS